MKSPFTKRHLKLAAWTLLALMIPLVTVFIITRAGLDEKLVKQRLDEYIVVLKEKGREHGRDIDLTYERLESTGNIAQRHVVVHNLVMQVKPQYPSSNPGENETVVISTDSLEIHPRSMDLARLYFVIPNPIEFNEAGEGGKSLLKISADAPLAATVEQHKVKDVPYVKIDQTLPGAIDLNYLREQRAEGEEDETPTLVPVYDTIKITIAPNSTISSDFAADGSGLGTFDASLKQVTTVPASAPEGLITVAGIEMHWKSSQTSKGAVKVENKVDFGPVTASNDVLPYAPIHLEVDVAYDSASEGDGAERSSAPEATLLLRKFSLSTKESTLSASADFKATPTDILPAGNARVTLTNTPYVRTELRKHEILDAESEAWVSELIQRMTGTAFDELKDLDLAIERQPGGTFKIGNSTFEEVFATILKHALKIKNPERMMSDDDDAPVTPVPQLPDASKPKSKPIAVPDNGVRG